MNEALFYLGYDEVGYTSRKNMLIRRGKDKSSHGKFCSIFVC